MGGKRWIKSWLVIISSFSIIVMATNYLVDPFDIFHTKILKHQFQVNERFVKIDFLDKNRDKFNGYLFGSSRIGTIQPKFVEKYTPNLKIYNFTLSDANLYDYMVHLKYFIKNRYSIDTLFLQLDLNNMSNYNHADSNYLIKIHPSVENKSIIKYYISYLFGLFPFNIKGKILRNFYNYGDDKNYSISTGAWRVPLMDKFAKEKPKEYINRNCFNITNSKVTKYTKRAQDIKALKTIKQLCNKHNIKLYVFVSPINKNMLDSFVIKDYFIFLKDISKITNFYDFSGYNSITNNNWYYYEISHYRPIVGKLIFARIFNDKSIKVPKDFGVYVTKENIDKHLKNLKKEIRKNNK